MLHLEHAPTDTDAVPVQSVDSIDGAGWACLGSLPRKKRSRKRHVPLADCAAAPLGLAENMRPTGPRSLTEVLAWATHAVARVREEMGMELVHNLGAMEVVLTTSYSGMGCAETAMSMLQVALQHGGGAPAANITCFSACDLNETCRQLLLAHTGPLAPQHVFRNVLDRAPSAVVESLERKGERLRDLLRLRLSAARDRGMDAKALRHCKDAQVAKMSARYLQVAIEALEACFPFDSDAALWCEKCNGHCRVCPPTITAAAAPRLHIEVAGTTCVAWSSMGAKLHWLDASALPCLVWMFSMLSAAPSIIVHECVVGFDDVALKRVLGRRYCLVPCVFSPSDLGIPTARRRKYTLCIRTDLLRSQLCRAVALAQAPAPAAAAETVQKKARGTMQLSSSGPGPGPGPLPLATVAEAEPPGIGTLQAEVETEAEPLGTVTPGAATAVLLPVPFTASAFASFFFRALEVDASVYFVASAAEVQEECRRTALERGLEPNYPWDTISVLTPSQRQHLRAYESEELSCSMHPSFNRRSRCCQIVDLVQSPYHCGQQLAARIQSHRLQPVPALLRGSLMYSMQHQRCLTPHEHLLVQGFPVPGLAPDTASHFFWPYMAW